MTRRRGWILIMLGLLLAIGAGAMVYFVIDQNKQDATAKALEQVRLEESQKIPTRPIPVARRALEPGTILSSTDYDVKDYPIDLIPSTVISTTEGISNQILIQPVAQGEYFRTSQILGGTGTSLGQQVKEGQVLLVLPLLDLLTQSNLLQEGDHIDLLLTVSLKDAASAGPDPNSAEEAVKATAFTLQNIEVFRLLRPAPTEEDQNPAPTAMIFSLQPQDAIMLKFIKDFGGSIDFVLRSPIDDQVFDVPPVTEVDLSRFYAQ